MLSESYLDAAPFTRVTPCPDFFMGYLLVSHFQFVKKIYVMPYEGQDGVERIQVCEKRETPRSNMYGTKERQTRNGERGAKNEEREPMSQ
jgi:hypothetical protein